MLFEPGDRVEMEPRYWHMPLRGVRGTVVDARDQLSREDHLHIAKCDGKNDFPYKTGMIQVELDEPDAWSDPKPWFAPDDLLLLNEETLAKREAASA